MHIFLLIVWANTLLLLCVYCVSTAAATAAWLVLSSAVALVMILSWIVVVVVVHSGIILYTEGPQLVQIPVRSPLMHSLCLHYCYYCLVLSTQCFFFQKIE